MKLTEKDVDFYMLNGEAENYVNGLLTKIEKLEAVAEAANWCGYDHKTGSTYGFDRLRAALVALKEQGK